MTLNLAPYVKNNKKKKIISNPVYYIYRTPLSIFMKTIPFHRAFDHSVLDLFRMYGPSGSSQKVRSFFCVNLRLLVQIMMTTW
jgi:hypothetical protein